MKNYTVTDRPTNTKYALRVISVTKNRKKSVLAGINYPGLKIVEGSKINSIKLEEYQVYLYVLKYQRYNKENRHCRIVQISESSIRI